VLAREGAGIAQVRDKIDALLEGTWSERGSGGGGPKDGELAEAIVTATGRGTKETVLARLRALRETDEGAAQIRAYRDDPRVDVALQRMAEVRAKEKRKEAEKLVSSATLDLGALTD